jgi:hypothetical protein
MVHAASLTVEWPLHVPGAIATRPAIGHRVVRP